MKIFRRFRLPLAVIVMISFIVASCDKEKLEPQFTANGFDLLGSNDDGCVVYIPKEGGSAVLTINTNCKWELHEFGKLHGGYQDVSISPVSGGPGQHTLTVTHNSPMYRDFNGSIANFNFLLPDYSRYCHGGIIVMQENTMVLRTEAPYYHSSFNDMGKKVDRWIYPVRTNDYEGARACRVSINSFDGQKVQYYVSGVQSDNASADEFHGATTYLIHIMVHFPNSQKPNAYCSVNVGEKSIGFNL